MVLLQFHISKEDNWDEETKYKPHSNKGLVNMQGTFFHLWNIFRLRLVLALHLEVLCLGHII